MKKKLHFQPVLFLVPILALFILSFYNGAPSAVTGSPGDSNNNCTACHTSAATYNAFNLSVNITTDIPTGGYALNHKYTITVTQTSTGATEHGFQITTEMTNASKIGQFSALETVNTTIQNLGGGIGTHVTNTAPGGDVNTWSFYWTAPSFDAGAITFYVASITGNKNSSGGHTTQDTEFASNTLTIDGVLGISSQNLLNFSMYPNPCKSTLNLQLPSGTNSAKVHIFDYLGKRLMLKDITSSNSSLNISNLSSGIYFIRIQTNSKVGTKKLIIR